MSEIQKRNKGDLKKAKTKKTKQKIKDKTIKLTEDEKRRIKALEKEISYVFKNKQLALNAITHKSYANENKVESYERLEFLGDSILSYVITNELYFKKTNDKAEGDMTKIRSYIVCEDALYEVSETIGGRKIIRTGKTHENPETLSKAILADMIEAVIAAVYCDSDIHQAKRIVLKFLNKKIDEALESEFLEDYKTVFQEMAQSVGVHDIKYNVMGTTGPEHDKCFSSQLICNGIPIAAGKGKTKKESETDAARKAIEKIREDKLHIAIKKPKKKKIKGVFRKKDKSKKERKEENKEENKKTKK